MIAFIQFPIHILNYYLGLLGVLHFFQLHLDNQLRQLVRPVLFSETNLLNFQYNSGLALVTSFIFFTSIYIYSMFPYFSFPSSYSFNCSELFPFDYLLFCIFLQKIKFRQINNDLIFLDNGLSKSNNPQMVKLSSRQDKIKRVGNWLLQIDVIIGLYKQEQFNLQDKSFQLQVKKESQSLSARINAIYNLAKTIEHSKLKIENVKLLEICEQTRLFMSNLKQLQNINGMGYCCFETTALFQIKNQLFSYSVCSTPSNGQALLHRNQNNYKLMVMRI